MIAPKLRPGGVVLIDNTESHRASYRDALAFLEAPDNGLLTQTVPFAHGLEMAVKR